MSLDLSSLQAAAAAVLNGLPYFAGTGAQRPIPVLTEDLGDLANKMQIAIAKTGLFVLIQTPFGLVEYPNEPAPSLKAKLVATVIEDVTINRGAGGTGETVGRVAEAVAVALHQSDAAGLLLFSGIALSAKYLPRIARDVAFEGPLTPLAMPTRS